jgi:hypothetical protein
VTIRLPDPALKIDFAASLAEIRRSLLQDALGDTMRSLEVPEIDRALAECAPADSLRALAGHGLRGEIMFPVPVVLAANPRLLGYYRLLYGYSQKEFYTSATGIGRFKSMEERGVLTTANAAKLLALCRALCRAGAVLLAGIGQGVSTALLDDLTLLTLGPQLRGGANVRKGAAGIRTVFIAILELVRTAATEVGTTRIQIRNAAGRTVLIEFSPDPDIIIREEMSPGNYRGVIAIEVKGGSDFSNIHNRIGEAEKITSMPPDSSKIRHAFGWNDSGRSGKLCISTKRASNRDGPNSSCATCIHP